MPSEGHCPARTETAGALAGRASKWWELDVEDSDLQQLLEGPFTEGRTARQLFASDRLSDNTVGCYLGGIRMWFRWAVHQSNVDPQHDWLIAHPESKVDRFLADVLADDGPWCTKGNTELVSSTKQLCAAIVWLRSMQPGVPDAKNISNTHTKAVAQARRMRAAHRQSSMFDLFSTRGPMSRTVEDHEVDQLLQRCAQTTTRGGHYRHKVSFSLLASLNGGFRADELSQLCYSNLALSRSVQTLPAPNMQLMHVCMTKSKTNQSGELETATFARHSDPLKCVIGALARVMVYDLAMYQLLLVDMIRAGDRDWRLMHILWRDPGDIMRTQKYNDIVAPLKRAMQHAGITKAAVGHLGRNTGLAKLAELGLPLCLMRVWGRWSSAGCAMESSYLSKALLKDLEAAAQLAGHGRDWRTSHYLGRQLVKPPGQWVDAVVPGARTALAEVSERNRQAVRPQDRDCNAEVCLETLLHLGEVYWQDLACCQAASGPHSGVQQLPEVLAITATAEYATFQQQVAAAHHIMQQQQQQQPSERMQPQPLMQHIQNQLQQIQRGHAAEHPVDSRTPLQYMLHTMGPQQDQSRQQQQQRPQQVPHHQPASDGKPSIVSRLLQRASRLLASSSVPRVLSDGLRVDGGGPEPACSTGNHAPSTWLPSVSISEQPEQQQRLQHPRKPGRPPKKRGPGRPCKAKSGSARQQQWRRHQVCVGADLQPLRREAPPLFSSKLKTVAEGWAEWHGLGTGRPAVKLVCEQVAADKSMMLGRSNSNAKCLRTWLLRAVTAAQAAGVSENEALCRLQAVADSCTPGLSYLELMGAIAAMVRHQNSQQPEQEHAVKDLSVADILRKFTQQKLPVPPPLAASRSGYGCVAQSHPRQPAAITTAAKRSGQHRVSQGTRCRKRSGGSLEEQRTCKTRAVGA